MSNNQSKFVKFVKNNAALLLIAFCAVAIFTVVLAVNLQPDVPPVDNPVVNNPVDNPSEDVTTPDPTPVVKTEIVKVYFNSPLSYQNESNAVLFCP